MGEVAPALIKSHCNECLQSTSHELIARRVRELTEQDQEGNFMYGERMIFELVQCRGCENISLRRTYYHSGMEEESLDYFPPAISRRKPNWLMHFHFLSGAVRAEL